MKSGDLEIQKLALSAIHGWKQEGIKPYRDNLEALLDDVKFRNEVVLLLQNDDTIKPEHRAELMPVLLRLLFDSLSFRRQANIECVSWDAKPWSHLNGRRRDLHEGVSDGELFRFGHGGRIICTCRQEASEEIARVAELFAGF